MTWALAAACLTLVGSPAARADGSRPFGDSRVRAVVPEPGYPEAIAVHGHLMYVSSPAAYQTAGSGPSEIFAFDVRSGTLEATYEIAGQDLSLDHAVSGLAFDGCGRLYVIETQQGILRLSLDGQHQEIYAPPIGDLPPTAHGPLPPFPNDLAFDDSGYAYVTDSLQAAIWRIPPGGGQPELWFSDPRLDGQFGPNGLRISPDRSHVYFVVTLDDYGTGTIFTLPLIDQPTGDDLQAFAVFPYWQGPDGLAFGASGRLYVALALANQIAVLAPDGTDLGRFIGPADAWPAPVPYDAPASIAFDDRTRSLLVTNHAINSGIREHFVVFDVVVDDVGDPLPLPVLP